MTEPDVPLSNAPHSTLATPAPLTRTAQRSFLSEPLVHFVVLGALVFGADVALNMVRDDALAISIPTVVRDEGRAMFKASRGREPTPEEAQILVDRWVDNEVLYREGLALGLDRGDASIRERVIFKALSVTQSGLSLPPITDADLRAWFNQHHDKYDEPPRFDFLEAVSGGDRTEGAARTLAVALSAKSKSDVDSSLQVFRGRPRQNLVVSYGEVFTKALESATPQHWAVLQSASGWHVVQLESIKPAVLARYEDVRDLVKKDWGEQTMAQLTSEAVRAMEKKYRVKQEAPGKAGS